MLKSNKRSRQAPSPLYPTSSAYCSDLIDTDRHHQLICTCREHNKRLAPPSLLIYRFNMSKSIIDEPDLALDQYDNIFILTMRKAPENRINSAYAQKLIAAYNKVHKILGDDAEGAVITKGNDAKFWCTVSVTANSQCGNHLHILNNVNEQILTLPRASN